MCNHHTGLPCHLARFGKAGVASLLRGGVFSLLDLLTNEGYVAFQPAGGVRNCLEVGRGLFFFTFWIDIAGGLGGMTHKYLF